MSMRDGYFEGSYEPSRYSVGTLETDILNVELEVPVPEVFTEKVQNQACKQLLSSSQNKRKDK